jgi:hypothetical protein
MKKWGIPAAPSGQQRNGRGGMAAAPEIALLERLVWVRYQNHWWPALLYHSYTELQQHLYDRLDTILKAQFAMAIMRHLQEKKEIKVARLLGRPILEVIEVEEDCYCEFYWQLPNVLPKACNKARYAGNMELYYDFHRALDQVEDIIRDVSQENFALMPKNDHQTWSERAQLYAAEDLSSVRSPTPVPKNGKPPRSRRGKGEGSKAEGSKTDGHKGESSKSDDDAANALAAGALAVGDPKLSSAHLPLQKEVEPAEMGVWGLLKSYSHTFEESYKGLINGNTVTEHAVSTMPLPPVALPSTVADGVGTGMIVNSLEEYPSTKERKDSQPPQTSEFITRDHRLRRPNVTGNENQGYEMEMMVGRSRSKGRSRRSTDTGEDDTKSDQAQPAPQRASAIGRSQRTDPAGSLTMQYDKYVPGIPSPVAPDESRDPPSESATSGGKQRAGKSRAAASIPAPVERAERTRTPVQILPGLEGDDILPGLSDKVGNARDIWSTVWSQMLLSKGDEVSAQHGSESDRNIDELRKAMQEKSLLDKDSGSIATGKTSVTTKAGNITIQASTDITPSTEQAKPNDLVVSDRKQESSFWHSMLGCAPTTY